MNDIPAISCGNKYPFKMGASRPERLRVWLRNFMHVHERVMMRYLRRRGWVVFYLEPRYRMCSPGPCNCWMKLYEEGEARERSSFGGAGVRDCRR